MAAKMLPLAWIRSERGRLSPPPRYPSMPTYPKGVGDEEKCIEGSEAKALFSVTGMTCSACAASVEKAVKRLPGIKDAAVDVLNHRSQVIFCPAFVNVSLFLLYFSCMSSINSVRIKDEMVDSFNL